ncbi:DNA translocase FtsK [Dysgonomonas sp. 216]|uniref:FtsK/SpoIIIE family DNA translocase n=1 Tax=Dysgonomonas sp. 216 TaxID=2302934 RepID=UPI0013D53BBC|nr:DNA translocase FtsK [Dysgonomonas sp. 216]NDW18309.1 DNA translocase FtsK [Dysgonomonas sp. 216]NDW18677.1 DNA translocase FtsK [Dysgonomonas sp. 216]
MAKKKKTKKKGGKGKFSILLDFMKSERGNFILGVSILFIAAFMLLGMVSFFFTGAADQSKVVNKTFFELIPLKKEISNWGGVGGAYISEQFVNGYFGIFSLLIPIYVGLIGMRLMNILYISLIRSFFVLAFVLIWGSVTSSLILSNLFSDSYIIWGGSHGLVIEQFLESAVGIPGVVMIVLLLLILFIVVVRSTSVTFFRDMFAKPFNLKRNRVLQEEEEGALVIDNFDDDLLAVEEEKPKKSIFDIFRRKQKDLNNNTESGNEFAFVGNIETADKEEEQHITMDDDFEIVVPTDEQPYRKENENNTAQPNSEEDDDDLDKDTEGEDFEEEELEDYDPTADLSRFAFPSVELLKIYDYSGKGVDMNEQRANKEKIITTLRNYGIEITSIKATVGPTITLYEIVPQAGVRISKIRNLEDDIALSLSALGIRIIAPMPGKGTIGIEVPNKDPQIVSMQSIIASRNFQECAYDLPVALGKTITNEVFMFDLCKMPHLLVAGATGQGKSVGLNAIITSLLYKKHPAEMKMVLVDPKMVEFNIYSRIEKHYLAKLPDAEKAIITDVTKVTQTLNSLTKEMDDRYELLMAASVRTIKEYNEKFKKRRLNPLKGHRFLPYIVVIIDEFGDLIMTAGKEIEMPIARIAQKARAVGIHMIIATQRPTTNIITGTIKANFPARMAFRVTSQIDSRTILDMSGANQLIGRGDLLFSQGSDLIRIQCAFVDTPEVEGLAQFIGNQQGYAHAFELPEYVSEGGGDDKPGAVDLNDKDPLFEEAARLLIIHQQGSTSLIQRKFSIGYNRAGRLMDQLEAAGIVGPTQGSKARDVLIADEYSLEQKLTALR